MTEVAHLNYVNLTWNIAGNIDTDFDLSVLSGFSVNFNKISDN